MQTDGCQHIANTTHIYLMPKNGKGDVMFVGCASTYGSIWPAVQNFVAFLHDDLLRLKDTDDKTLRICLFYVFCS